MSAGLRLLFLTLALCASALSSATARGQGRRARPILEVDADASRVVDARVTERLVALETADVDVPAPPGVSFSPPLYFRILSLPRASLRVELWELGRPYGERRVSATGTQILEARRIALAAAELARQLRERRVIELSQARREKSALSLPTNPRTGTPLYARLAWSAGAVAAAVGGSAWLVGPEADASVRFHTGPRLTLGAAWLQGRAALASERPAMRWFDVHLSSSFAGKITRDLGVDAGLAAALAQLRFSDAPGEPRGSLDTWSARVTGFVRAELRLGRHATMAAGPDVGVLLRPVDVNRADGGASHLGGLWLGGAVTLALDPSPR